MAVKVLFQPRRLLTLPNVVVAVVVPVRQVFQAEALTVRQARQATAELVLHHQLPERLFLEQEGAVAETMAQVI